MRDPGRPLDPFSLSEGAGRRAAEAPEVPRGDAGCGPHVAGGPDPGRPQAPWEVFSPAAALSRDPASPRPGGNIPSLRRSGSDLKAAASEAVVTHARRAQGPLPRVSRVVPRLGVVVRARGPSRGAGGALGPAPGSPGSCRGHGNRRKSPGPRGAPPYPGAPAPPPRLTRVARNRRRGPEVV